MSESKTLTAVDLFSGCGGLTQGLKEAEFDVLAAVEMDPLAAETYAINHPAVKVLQADIQTVSSAEFLNATNIAPGDLDLLAGCPPCQGFSRMRNRNQMRRMADPRNRLIDEVLRIVEALQPKAIMLENVPNLERYSRYSLFKKNLRSLGYNVADGIFDVAEFGVPQRRRRLVVLASRVGKISNLSAPKIRTTVRDAIGFMQSSQQGLDPLHNVLEKRSLRVRELIKLIPKDGGSRSALPKHIQLKCHSRSDGHYDVYGRMRWDDVAPTITGGCVNPSKGRFLHPVENRAITLREAALLQSFPPDYYFSLRRGKYAAAEMIGNALPPTFSRIQGEAIKAHLSIPNYFDRGKVHGTQTLSPRVLEQLGSQ